MATQSLLDAEGRWVWEEVKKEEHNQNALYEILKELITVTISRVQNKLSKNLEDLVFCYCFLGSWLHTGSLYFYYRGQGGQQNRGTQVACNVSDGGNKMEGLDLTKIVVTHTQSQPWGQQEGWRFCGLHGY